MGVFIPQGAAANPDSEEQQQKLREAAEGLRMATNAAAQNAIKKRLVNKLEVKQKEAEQTTQIWFPAIPFHTLYVLNMCGYCYAVV